MTLDARTAQEVARFLNEPHNRDRFADRLDEWGIATDALEEAGFIHHAQQIRALIRLASNRRFAFSESRTLDELRLGARDLLTGGPAPREIWGDVREHNGELYLDSIYARGFPSLRVERLPREQRLRRSGERMGFFRTIYAGHHYSGRSSDSFVSFFRQRPVTRRSRRR